MYVVKFWTDGKDDPIAFQLKEYNEKIKNALGIVTLYGEDIIELVVKGSLIESSFKIRSLKEIIQEFKEEGYKDVYFHDFDSDYIDECIEILEKVAVH